MNKITNKQHIDFLDEVHLIKQMNPAMMSGNEKREARELNTKILDGENEQGREIVAGIILDIGEKYNRSSLHIYIDGEKSNILKLRSIIKENEAR